MKIDINYKFKNLDGLIVPEGPDEPEEIDGEIVMKNGKPVMKKSPSFTLRKACINVLIMVQQRSPSQAREKELSAEDKIERYELAKKIHKSSGLVDLERKEITLLMELIGKIYPPLTVGQAFEILDPHSEKK